MCLYVLLSFVSEAFEMCFVFICYPDVFSSAQQSCVPATAFAVNCVFKLRPDTQTRSPITHIAPQEHRIAPQARGTGSPDTKLFRMHKQVFRENTELLPGHTKLFPGHAKGFEFRARRAACWAHKTVRQALKSPSQSHHRKILGSSRTASQGE